MRWIVVILALVMGVWLTFDGARAFLVGDYLTSASGPRAGQLGPWSKVVASLGFEPRSALLKGLHVVLGTAWLFFLACFLLGKSAAWWMLLGCCLATLWYLPLGTLISLVLFGLLWVPRIWKLP